MLGADSFNTLGFVQLHDLCAMCARRFRKWAIDPSLEKGKVVESCPIVHLVYMLSSSPGSSGRIYMPYVAITLQVQKFPQSSQSSVMAVYEIRQRRDMHQTYVSRAIDITNPFPMANHEHVYNFFKNPTVCTPEAAATRALCLPQTGPFAQTPPIEPGTARHKLQRRVQYPCNTLGRRPGTICVSKFRRML